MGRRRKTNITNDDHEIPGTSQQVKTHRTVKLRGNNSKRPGIEKNQGNSNVKFKSTNAQVKPGTSKLKDSLGTRKDDPNAFKRKRKTKSKCQGRKKADDPKSSMISNSRASGNSESQTNIVRKNKTINTTGRKKKCIGNTATTATTRNASKQNILKSSQNSVQTKKSPWKKFKVARGKKPAIPKNKANIDKKSDDIGNRASDSKSRWTRKRKCIVSHPSGSSESDEKPSCSKRSRMQSPVTVTTRAMRAKKVGVTRFIFDKVCACSEKKQFNIYVDGGIIKGCVCGKRYEQFLKLTGGFEKESEENTEGAKKSQRHIDYFSILSMEMICHIFQYLTLREVLRFESLSRKLQNAVHAALAIREEIDFNEEVGDKGLFNDNLHNMTNKMFASLLKKVPRVRNIYNFHPANISLFPSSNSQILTTPGVCDALNKCEFLEGIEISNMELLECIVSKNVHPKIIGKFANRHQEFPVLHGGTTVLKEESRITHLHLVGCSLYYMPQMDNHLEHLYLRMVKFVHHHPFKDFSACKLKSFVMSHCIGPSSALKYIPLLTALADARGLKRLELQRVPFLGGVLQHICEDNWQEGGFRRLTSISMGACKNALDADLGFLIIAAAAYIETLRIQPTLTKDAVFSALAISDVTINPGFEELCLGWKETVPGSETLTDAEIGLADLPESHSRITDSGMQLVGQCFPPLKKLEVNNCPNLINPLLWVTPGQPYLRHIQELTLDNCHSLRVDKFWAFLTFLPELRSLTLRDIFKEPPLGCSRVGLSAGTGLGISAAFINPQPIVNQPGGLNNNDDDDDDNDAAGNNPENAAINNNQPRGQVQGHNGGHDNGNENEATNQNEERENANSGYNLRRSSRTDSSHKSSRNVRNSNQAACDKNKNSAHESSSASGSSEVDGKNRPVSKRGKALVTKKGLVCKVKSSNGKGKNSEDAGLPSEKDNKVCTCQKEKKEVGCQVTNDDIRKSISQKKGRKKRTAQPSQDRIIKARKYKPSSMLEAMREISSCEVHTRKKKTSSPVTVDKCDSTNDPVWEDDHSMSLTILHRRLEYLRIEGVGATELKIVCYNLQTLSVSRCRVLKDIKLKQAPFLDNVHVSQCRKFREDMFLDEIYRLPPNRSKFVSLRPLHHVDEELYHELIDYGDIRQYSFGTMMMFDYSDKPSQTNYNKLRMKSWTNILERMTMMTMMDHGWQRFNEMDNANKGLGREEGTSIDGSNWKLLDDIPWISELRQCPDMEEKFLKNPEWKKPGVYCMEAKGHFSFWDAYSDVQDFIAYMGPDQCGLYEYNVLTYINMCDIDGIPKQDALKVV